MEFNTSFSAGVKKEPPTAFARNESDLVSGELHLVIFESSCSDLITLATGTLLSALLARLNPCNGLPKVGEYGSILVVVDRFYKYATFIPAPTYCSAEETAYLFLKYIVKYWGVPRNIVSDRDSRFTGRFWTELGLSSISRPVVIPGQTERFNSMLEEYLRHFVSANQGKSS